MSIRRANSGISLQGIRAGTLAGLHRVEVENTISIQDIKEHADVFETGVHALSVERHHSVRGIAEDNDAGAVMVGCTFYVY